MTASLSIIWNYKNKRSEKYKQILPNCAARARNTAPASVTEVSVRAVGLTIENPEYETGLLTSAPRPPG
jgi:hypothetical protein